MPVYYLVEQARYNIKEHNIVSPGDIILVFVMASLLVVETIADQQQWNFHQLKSRVSELRKRAKDKDIEKSNMFTKKYMEENKLTKEEVNQASAGFVHTGLWKYSRHPNFFCEQAFWVTLMLFSNFGSRSSNFLFTYNNQNELLVNYNLLEYSVGSFILVALFYGSTKFTEEITSSKYPRYKEYVLNTNKLLPWTSKPLSDRDIEIKSQFQKKSQ
ncbi:hypothetical protein BB558_005518 [Smittium angustum]|uniref:Steroid 5-alpha reductase C-terminal domain-containing protein n=1 Tax=Smittium angustum TaxID=133377 RepID=A0A2U1J0I1_SMIAN|nr:hypothetical protein BB558_005518 [Smittium angustum]